MTEKPDYKLKLTDFIPVVGLARYISRNSKSHQEFVQQPESVRYGSIERAILLSLYTLTITGIATIMAMPKGLEKLVN